MTKTPDVSVVMSVYNGAEHLGKSIDSILSQGDVDFEFIIIDDGSTDDSGRILDEYAGRDCRVRVIHQENTGLTRALIRGCSEARGIYIARQDAGDISLPGRLKKQIDYMRHHPSAALVSCGTRFFGPKGEHLYEINQDPGDATDRLLTLDPGEIRGPSHHGSTFLSSAIYKKAGGYRDCFYFAQDLDLWVRMAEHGLHLVIPEVLYQSFLTTGAISNVYRKEQTASGWLILECARLRRSGVSEAPSLERAKAIRPTSRRRFRSIDQARVFYFIGSCLKKQGDPQADHYLRLALRKFPLHLKSLARLFLGNL